MKTLRHGDLHDLQEKIRQRRLSAERKNLAAKANLIARCLGSIAGDVKHSPIQLYDKDGLRIAIALEVHSYAQHRYARNVEITYKDMLVFDKYLTTGEIRVYIPGPWEKVLRRLHTEALKTRSKRAADDATERDLERAAGLVELASRFGL